MVDGLTFVQAVDPDVMVEEAPGDPVAAAVADLLSALGVDEGAHTADTPRRVAAAWRDQLAGYAEDPRAHLKKTFPAPENPGLVVVSGLRLQSTCAHHLLPITGRATVAYRPRVGDPVVGLSKLSRLLDGYARRLQVQEQIGAQVVTAIQDVLDPVGSACVITAEHGCMSIRGVMEPGATTTTTALGGEWLNEGGGTNLEQVLTAHRS